MFISHLLGVFRHAVDAHFEIRRSPWKSSHDASPWHMVLMRCVVKEICESGYMGGIQPNHADSENVHGIGSVKVWVDIYYQLAPTGIYVKDKVPNCLYFVASWFVFGTKFGPGRETGAFDGGGVWKV